MGRFRLSVEVSSAFGGNRYIVLLGLTGVSYNGN